MSQRPFGDPDASAAPTMVYRATATPPESLRRQLREAPGFSAAALGLAVGGSVVGTVMTGFFGTGQWGTLAGAAMGPVISTVFSTRVTGEKGRVRTTAILLLSVVALTITWIGFSVTDAAAGTSVVPGTDHRSSTFPGIGSGTQPRQTVAVSTHHSTKTASPSPSTAQLDVVPCGDVAVGSAGECPAATITYTGGGRLHITGVEVTGPDSADFTPSRDCLGTWLDPGENCRITVEFRPSAIAVRHATLIVHENLPKPDRGAKAALTGTGVAGTTDPDTGTSTDPGTGTGTGTGTCLTGYVWREAVDGDQVCVTPEVRSEDQQDNALAGSRRDPSGAADGTCLDGFVWRQATPGDHVCVTPEVRSRTGVENQLAADRRIN